MQRKTANERCERLKNLDALPLRQKCLRFVLDHQSTIAQAQPQIPPDLNDRAADIWEPLFVLADIAGGPWPERTRQAALALSPTSQESDPIAALLLQICTALLNVERMFSRDLVDHLNRLPARPWAENLRGKHITELWLAHKLRPYGIRPRTIWVGPTSARGYQQADFIEVFSRYIRSDLRTLLGEE